MYNVYSCVDLWKQALLNLAVLLLKKMKLVNYVYDGRVNKPFHDFFSFNFFIPTRI